MENKNITGSPDSDIREELLCTWLTFTSAVRSERIVRGFTFREILILHILYNSNSACSTTATDIVNATGMLKPQVNKLLDSLEARRLITRQRSETDRRYVLISLTPFGQSQYLAEHANIISLLDAFVGELGENGTHGLIDDMNNAAVIMKDLISRHA